MEELMKVCACVRNGAEKEIRPAQEQESKKMDENCHCRGGDRGRYVSWSLFRLYGGGAVRFFV